MGKYDSQRHTYVTYVRNASYVKQDEAILCIFMMSNNNIMLLTREQKEMTFLLQQDVLFFFEKSLELKSGTR